MRKHDYNPFFEQVDRREPDPYNVCIVGWEGDSCPVIVSERGTFHARLGEIYCRFAIADDTGPIRWENAEGYLPCLVSSFQQDDVSIEISHFCNKVNVGGHDYSLLYSRVKKTSEGWEAVDMPAAPSADLVRISPEPGPLGRGETQVEDFVTCVDRFGDEDAPWPDVDALRAAGSWDENYALMRDYWNGRLSGLANIERLPDQRMVNAFRAGYIYQLIIMDGVKMHVGVNAYREEFSHDTIGLMTAVIQMGDFDLARRVLDAHRGPLVAPLDYPDGDYKYAWPWALYLLKTGDEKFVRGNFWVIRAIVRASGSQATGPGGIMRLSHALDHPGHWLVDNWSMLTGLAAYKVICERLGERGEVRWAQETYDKLLDACNQCLEGTMKREGIDYLPASMLNGHKDSPNKDSRSAGWATCLHFGRWPWEGYMLGARQEGVMLDHIDATYDWGFDQSRNALPPHTFGGWPGWCCSYNAGFAMAALRGDKYRSEGILAYQFMIDNAMNGPYAWWEGCGDPDPDSRWQPGLHPKSGTGSCPHAWGDSFSRMILLKSLIDEFADGRVIIGRGIPEQWLEPGQEIRVSNVPLRDLRRFGYELKTSDDAISISFFGDTPAGDTVLDLPGPLPSGVTADGVDLPGPFEGQITVPAKTREVVIGR